MADYVLAIDQGTTSSRAIIFDKAGSIVSTGQLEHEQIFPKAGWVEHDPAEIWRNTGEVIGQALGKANLTRHDIAAVGITNQRETAVVWDRRTGEPVYNAIVWQDTRTQSIVDRLAADGGVERFKAKVGLPLATYFSGTKIVWILENVPGAREKAEAGDLLFGTTDTWVLWNLTGGVDGGVHATDVTNASRTMFMDLETLQWDDEILAAFGVPRSMLPEIRSSSEVYGVANEHSLLRETPIAGILGDQQAATFGQAAFDAGEAKNTYGTGNFLIFNTGEEIVHSKNGLLTTVGYKLGDQPVHYALEGSIAVTGSLIQWLRDNLGLISSAAEVEALANGGRGQRRRVLRAGVLGPLRPVLASRRARRARGPHPLREQGTHRAGGTRGHRVPDPRRRRGRERRRRHRPHRAARRRRGHRQRHPAAVPGRHPRRAGRAPGRGRDDRARRGLCRRARGRLLVRASTSSARTGRRTAAGRRRWTRRSVHASIATGRRPSRRPSTGSTSDVA